MKMHEKKLKRFSIYKKIANVLFILTIIFGVLALLATVIGQLYIANNSNEIVDTVSKYLEEQDFTVRITEDFTIPNGLFYVFMAYIVLSLSLTAYLFKSIGRLFGFVIEDKTPFTQKVVKSLKSMGIAFFVYLGLKFILSISFSPAMGNAIHLGFDSIEYKYILFGILLLALGEIFEFGMNLQQDNESII